MLFVSFYTNHGEYPSLARDLVDSLKAFDLPHRVAEVPDMGTWQQTVRSKARFVLDVLLETRKRITWVDCDCVVVKRPDLLLNSDPKHDFAIFNWREPMVPGFVPTLHVATQVSSGVMMWDYTAPAIETLCRWIEHQHENPDILDDPALDEVLTFDKPPLIPLWLPSSYNRMSPLGFAHVDPVIDHRINCGRYRDH